MEWWNLQTLKKKIVEFNLFESIASRHDEYELVTERLSTRAYSGLLILSIFIIFVTTLSIIQTTTVTINNPSQVTFERLQSMYPSSLQCPCSSISIPYGHIISIEPIYHQLCSSMFISNEWIILLDNFFRSYYMQLDFRATGTSIFQLLRTFCQTVQTSVQDALDVFNQIGLLISPQVLSSTAFSIQADAIIAQFKLTIPNTFLRTLSFVRGVIQSNQFLPAVHTNRQPCIPYINKNTLRASVYNSKCTKQKQNVQNIC